MKCWQDAGQLELFTHCWWEDIGTVALENNLSNKVNLSMIYVQAIPCLGLRSRIYSRKFTASHPGEHKTRKLETTQMSINQRKK